MLAFVIALTKLHGLVPKHSNNLLPATSLRIELKLNSECTLHSLNVTKFSKSIVVKNSKDKMTCHLAQLSKGFNVELFKGFVTTQRQAADLGTKYYSGLVSNINSDFWLHGSVDKFIPLQDKTTTYLYTQEDRVIWTGIKPSCNVNRCNIDFCSHIVPLPIYDPHFVIVQPVTPNFGNPTKLYSQVKGVV